MKVWEDTMWLENCKISAYMSVEMPTHEKWIPTHEHNTNLSKRFMCAFEKTFSTGWDSFLLFFICKTFFQCIH